MIHPGTGRYNPPRRLRGRVRAGCKGKSTLRIEINGEDLQLDEPATVATLIQQRSPRPPFAVEVNKRLVRRPEYTTQKLNDGDRVEIVTLVGGG